MTDELRRAAEIILGRCVMAGLPVVRASYGHVYNIGKEAIEQFPYKESDQIVVVPEGILGFAKGSCLVLARQEEGLDEEALEDFLYSMEPQPGPREERYDDQ